MFGLALGAAVADVAPGKIEFVPGPGQCDIEQAVILFRAGLGRGFPRRTGGTGIISPARGVKRQWGPLILGQPE